MNRIAKFAVCGLGLLVVSGCADMVEPEVVTQTVTETPEPEIVTEREIVEVEWVPEGCMLSIEGSNELLDLMSYVVTDIFPRGVEGAFDHDADMLEEVTEDLEVATEDYHEIGDFFQENALDCIEVAYNNDQDNIPDSLVD